MTQTSRLLILVGVALLWAGPAWATPAADTAWEAVRTAAGAGVGDLSDKSSRERLEAFNAREERIRGANLEFYEGFPDDPRRWDAALTLLRHNPRHIGGWTEAGQPIRDEAAATAWREQQAAIRATMLEQFASLPRPVQERLEAQPIFDDIGGLFHKLENEQPVDWATLRNRLDLHLAKYPEVPAIAGVVSRYMGMFERAHPADVTLAEWRALTRNPVVRDNDMIVRRLEVVERESQGPMELKFTAVDGREVDLAKMRGKVVLIDVWATWCQPCIAELPTIKKAYADYHAQGFEVIGITLENARLRPDDSPEQVANKHAAAKKRLLDFVAEWELPWPQHYDGRFWQNEIARGRFNISAVPATFLIDREGRLAAVNVRGPQLAQEVRRLLQ
jgi:thiol-disulfide isomerase/thioredoxin